MNDGYIGKLSVSRFDRLLHARTNAGIALKTLASLDALAFTNSMN